MYLQNSVKVSYEEGCYVLDGCLVADNTVMAFATSSQKIRCYDSRTTTFLFELNSHNGPITDMVTVPVAHPSLLFSCQDNTGVMISDVRMGKPVHFLSELTQSGMQSYSLSVSEDGLELALATNGDVQFVDTRTWSSIRSIPQLHTDEITRLRFCGSSTLCTAGEDQLVNFVNTKELNEDDMMLNIMNCEEVITRMAFHSPATIGASGEPYTTNGVVTLIGSCENAYVCPLVDGVHETKIPRPNFETYLVDFCAWQQSLCLVNGSKDDDANIGPLGMLRFPDGAPVGSLRGAHNELGRCVMSLGDTLVTGGEDGTIAYWRPEEVREAESDKSSDSSSMKSRPKLDMSRGMSSKKGKPY